MLLYRELLKRLPSGVVALNHAAAVAMADGPEQGLSLLAALENHPELAAYQPFYATRAELRRRLGRFSEALPDYRHALSLAKNEPERRLLARRIAEVEALVAEPR